MFPTTRWSVLAAATLSGDVAGREALSRLCLDYRGPVVAFLRTRGFREEEAQDHTQEFFLRLLESRAWKRAERARGRFRTFLLGALMHTLAHARDRAGAEKRGGGNPVLSLDDLSANGFDAPAISPEATTEFDRAWAFGLMEAALAGVEREFREDNRAKEFVALRRFLPGPEAPPSYDAVALELDRSLGWVKSEIHRLRQRFRQALRAEVARTVSAPHEIDAELAFLRSILMGASE